MKIVNCITNSFFRTIGRILAYLAIGALFVALLSKANLPSFDEVINNSLFMNVNASTFTNVRVQNLAYSTTYNGSFSSMTLKDDRFFEFSPTINHEQRYYIKFDNYVDLSNVEYFYYNIRFDALKNTGFGLVDNNFDCTITNNSQVDYYATYDSNTQYSGYYELEQFIPNGFSCNIGLDGSIDHYNSGFALMYGSDDTFTQQPCYAMSYSGDVYSFKCPVNSSVQKRVYGLVLRVNSYNQTQFKIGVSDWFTLETSDTSTIINNNNQNTQQIINNQQASTNATIENQNQNTQEQIQSQQVCTFVDKNIIKNDNKALNGSGELIDNNSFGVTDYINILSAKIKVISTYNTTAYFCFYNVNKVLIECNRINTLTENSFITIPQNANYFRSSINKTQNKPTYDICTNGNQALSNTLTDQSGPDNLGNIDNDTLVGYLPAGPIDSLITLPLVILNGINNSLSTTCSSISLPLPFVNEDIELPCMQSLYQKMGVLAYLNWAGIIASAFLLYSYLIRFYKWVDNVLTLRENNYLDNWGGAE